MKNLLKETKIRDTTQVTRSVKQLSAIVFAGLLFSNSQFSFAQESIAPPNLGDETKGTPAVAETELLPAEASIETALEPNTETTEEVASEENYGPLGQATITESRRESGQVYRVELEHSIGGATQVLEENDSDGKIDSRSTGLEEEANIPKWRIGSW